MGGGRIACQVFEAVSRPVESQVGARGRTLTGGPPAL